MASLSSSQKLLFLLRVGAILPLFSHVHSWTYPAHIDLAYPPTVHSGYINNTTPTPETYPNHDLIFKCDLYPVDENTPRVHFPITSGHVGLNITNGGITPPTGYYASLQWSIGQVSNLKLEEPLDSAVADSGEQWQDFTPRQKCSTIPVNATERILTLFNSAGLQNTGAVDMVGWNATIEADISLSTELGDTVEQMYQCGYVTFVTQQEFLDEFDGYCGPREQVPVTTGSATTTTAASSSTSASSVTAGATSTNEPSSSGSGSRLSKTAIGLIAGFLTLFVLMGLCLCWWYQRRRARARSSVSTAAGDADEPPPTYVEATEKGDLPKVERKERPEKLQSKGDEIRAIDGDYEGAEGSSKRK